MPLSAHFGGTATGMPIGSPASIVRRLLGRSIAHRFRLGRERQPERFRPGGGDVTDSRSEGEA